MSRIEAESVGESQPQREDSPSYVVGIGASAGGLEALEHFFENVPRDSGMAFVVVQHLSPDFKSLMDEILARRTSLPISLVEDSMVVESDHVYLIPPKKEMIISGGRLLLSEREHDQELSLPIDVFFRSLAQDCGPRAIAVVLSGSGSDGSRGIRAVHDGGGLVVLQDEETAQFDGMPKAARDVGVADYVLAPQDMPAALFEYASRASVPPPKSLDSEQGMNAVYRMLEQEFGIDFTHYKPSTITRRIERRLQLARVDDIDEYVERLKRDHKELDVLYRDLLIGVTRFFRNDEAFEVLERDVLGGLRQSSASDPPFRVWVAGCATGEEVYSLAILLHELTAGSGRQFKIFATDVHQGSLEHATRALYDEEAVVNVSPERLKRYFLPRAKSYQLVPELRQAVVFAHHNVIKDAPFTRVDLVSCRNMLIYLQPQAQERVLSRFHFALNRGGTMFLGPSESLGHLDQDFETIDKQWRIYRKYTDARVPVERKIVTLPKASMIRTASKIPARSPSRYSLTQLLGTYDALLDELMPPSLLLDDRGELMHSFAGASRFLKLRDGRQGLDAFEMVDSELKMVLIGGLQRVLKDGAPVVFKGVRVDGELQQVTIRRVQSERGSSPHVLVSFHPMAGDYRKPETGGAETEIDLSEVPRQQLVVLQAELSRTKEELQAASEELETSNEELQAANEELLASNEELQSTNEELQSVNEELYSVNAEYQRKISDLTELANDMDNLLSSTEVGTIFLDRELKIRKFTPQIAESFSLLPGDVGRPIETFTYAVDHPELTEDLKRVLGTGERVERELRDRHGRAFFLRVLPYLAKGSVDGVVLTLIDVSGLKAAEDALFHERYLLNSLLFSVPDAIYFKDVRGRFIRANEAMAKRLGLSDPREAVGKTAFELSNQEAALALHQQDDAVLRSGIAQHYELEKREGTEGETEWDMVSRLPLKDSAGRIVGIIGIFRSVTEQKRAEEKTKDAVRRRDEFLAMLSHELRNPLGAIVAATDLLISGAPSSEPGNDKIARILERQAQQMSRLLDDLLEASRVTQDKIELRRSVLDLRAVLKDAVEAMRNLAEARGVELALELPEEPLYVDGDPARLQQIHVNLLSNAIKYTPRGGHISFRAERAATEATVVVRDDGVGMSKEMLESAFELFVQSQRTLDRAEGGLGLGLTLVRGLVDKHGGTVSARSGGEGKGSEFVVRLPLVPAPVGPAPRRPRRGPGLGVGSKIVVIEDNADSREMLCDLLNHAGFECKAADSGAAGLALIAQYQPHAAIVDIGLPGIDGFELARRVRAGSTQRQPYLIALTGYGQRMDREMALEAGFNEHVVKPVDLEFLRELLTAHRQELAQS